MEEENKLSISFQILYGLEISLCFYCIRWFLRLKQIIQEKGGHEAMAENVFGSILFFVGGILLLDILVRLFSYLKRRRYKDVIIVLALSAIFIISFYFLSHLLGR